MQFIHNRARIFLILLACFLALSAFGGGVGLLTGWNAPPVQDLGNSIFRDYIVPGLALFIIVGGGALLSAMLLIRRHPLALPVAAAAGFAIMVFEFVEILVIGSPRGIAAHLAGHLLRRRRVHERHLHRLVAAGKRRRPTLVWRHSSGYGPGKVTLRLGWIRVRSLQICAGGFHKTLGIMQVGQTWGPVYVMLPCG